MEFVWDRGTVVDRLGRWGVLGLNHPIRTIYLVFKQTMTVLYPQSLEMRGSSRLTLTTSQEGYRPLALSLLNIRRHTRICLDRIFIA